MTRALVTTPTNTHAVTVYSTYLILSVLLLLGVAETRSLDAALPPGSKQMLPALMFASAVCCLASVFSAWLVAEEFLRNVLRAELVGAACLAVFALAYGWALTSTYGFSGGPITQTLVWTQGVGLVLRVGQILVDQAHLRRTRTAAVTTPGAFHLKDG